MQEDWKRDPIWQFISVILSIVSIFGLILSLPSDVRPLMIGVSVFGCVVGALLLLGNKLTRGSKDFRYPSKKIKSRASGLFQRPFISLLAGLVVGIFVFGGTLIIFHSAGMSPIILILLTISLSITFIGLYLSINNKRESFSRPSLHKQAKFQKQSKLCSRGIIRYERGVLGSVRKKENKEAKDFIKFSLPETTEKGESYSSMTTHTSTPQKLYLMQVASLSMSATTRPAPIPCYLVQMSDGTHILIDSGFPKEPPSWPGLQMHQDVIAQLALLNLQPEAIDLLICTHFDGDHCGHHEDFPNAQLVVQRAHYEAAHGGHQRFAATRPHWDLPASRYRLVDGDTELLPGLELVETSGHVPGHQSILLRLPETGMVLLTIDAVASRQFFQADRQGGPMDLDGEQAIASTRKLLDLVEREHINLVIFGHDGSQWETLEKLPQCYQ